MITRIDGSDKILYAEATRNARLASQKTIPIAHFGEGLAPNVNSGQQGKVDRRQEQLTPAGAWATEVGHEHVNRTNCTDGFVSNALNLNATAHPVVNHHSMIFLRRLGLDHEISYAMV